jgi:hypothetical protein
VDVVGAAQRMQDHAGAHRGIGDAVSTAGAAAAPRAFPGRPPKTTATPKPPAAIRKLRREIARL